MRQSARPFATDGTFLSRLPKASQVLDVWVKDADIGPVDRARLASYLELPSELEIDPTTDTEIQGVEARRRELVEFRVRTAAVPIAQVDGAWIVVEGGRRIEATAAYGRQLLENGADWLIVGAITLGPRVDAAVKSHLGREELFEAFILKQWAATLTEQTRSWLTHSLCGWADSHGRSVLPVNGPGYNRWPLSTLDPLVRMLQMPGAGEDRLPLDVTEAGMLLPVNSMVLVYGLTPRRVAVGHGEDLAQCHRCAMRNCRYRVAPFDSRGPKSSPSQAA